MGTTRRPPAWDRSGWGPVAVMAVMVILLAVASVQPARAEPPPPSTTSQATQVKAGIFITQLYDIDISRKSFNLTFWTWYLHDRDDYKPLETVEVVNAKSSAVRYPSTTEAAGLHYVQGKYYQVIAQDYDVTYYPFDRQMLQIFMEDAQTDAQSMVFVADSKNSGIDPALKIPGWTIESAPQAHTRRRFRMN